MPTPFAWWLLLTEQPDSDDQFYFEGLRRCRLGIEGWPEAGSYFDWLGQ